jgi:hypothetical protein
VNAILHSRVQPHQRDSQAERIALIMQLARRYQHSGRVPLRSRIASPFASSLSVLLVSPINGSAAYQLSRKDR